MINKRYNTLDDMDWCWKPTGFCPRISWGFHQDFMQKNNGGTVYAVFLNWHDCCLRDSTGPENETRYGASAKACTLIY